MSINLLPSEEKIKSGKIKYQPAPIVEMTGPVKVGKSKPAIKRGGVLGFFKQAFAKPKPVSPDAAKQLPEKKVMVEEKIIYEKQKPQPAQRPIIRMVAPPQEGMQVRGSVPIGQRIGNFFRNIFGSKPKTAITAPVVPPLHAENTFPKYQPVRAEAVRADEPLRRPRPIEVITVTTNGKQPEAPRVPVSAPDEGRRIDIPHEGFPKVEPAFTLIKRTSVPAPQPAIAHKSFWQKFAQWFRKLFARAPKQKIMPPTSPETTGTVQPHEPPIVVRTEQKIPPAQTPAPLPRPPLYRPSPLSQPIPLSSIRPNVMPGKPVEARPITEKMYVPDAQPKPTNIPLPPKQVSTPMPSIPIKPALTPAPPPPSAEKEVRAPWWKKIWNAILNTFRGKKSTGKKSFALRTGSVQNIPGVRLTEIKENGTKISPIEWEVNLVPEEAVEKALPISKILIGVLCVFVSIGIVFGGWIAANYYYSNVSAKVSGLNGQIASSRIEINSYQTVQQNVRDLNQSMSNIETLLKKHVYWSGIFNKLENYTVPEVYYTSFTADVNGAVALNAVGRDYASAIKQLEVLKRATDFVTKVTVTGICFTSEQKCSGTESSNLLIAPTDETVKFSVNVTVLSSLFYWPR